MKTTNSQDDICSKCREDGFACTCPISRPRSSSSFCARPGCGLAKTLHGYSATACANFVQPGSKEANALARELPTVAAGPLDSVSLDRILMAETILALEARIKQATQATQACLLASKAGAPRTASRYAERALRALGGLGAA